MDDARSEGIKKGMKKGIKKGEKRGVKRAGILFARNMLQKGYPIAEIQELSGISKQEMDALLEEQKASAVPA